MFSDDSAADASHLELEAKRQELRLQNCSKTVAVTVTYGDRSAMCIETIQRALGCGANYAVIVDNGSAPFSRAALDTYCDELADTVEIVRFEENVGTASAFSAAIAAALDRAATHVWLLDDDNWAAPGCLEACHEFLDALTADIGSNLAAVACNRDTDEHHSKLIAGHSKANVFEPDGAFFGFDLIRRLRNRWRRGGEAQEPGFPRLPQAPYGGLFASRDVFVAAGFPREDFVLYFDDVEYTRRFHRLGIPIFLCKDAKINDAGRKWVETEGNRYLEGMIKAGNNVRTYYSYRNSLILDLSRARLTGQVVRFVINLSVYSVYVASTCIRLRNREFFGVYVKGCLDGMLGKTGKRLALGGV